MRIGVDIDEVLTSPILYFVDYFNNKHNTNYSRENIEEYDFKSFHKYSPTFVLNEFINFIDNNLNDFNIDKDAKNVLKRLKNEGNELFILTARRLDIKHMTINWIEKHFGEGFFNDYLFYNRDKKEDICKSEICINNKIDVLIEDAPKYIENVAKNKIPVLMMDSPWNQKLKNNKFITRVHNWLEIEKELMKLNN